MSEPWYCRAVSSDGNTTECNVTHIQDKEITAGQTWWTQYTVHCNNSLHACGNRRTFHLQQIVPIWDTNHAERQRGKIIVQLDWFHGLIFNVFTETLVVGRGKTGQKARQDVSSESGLNQQNLKVFVGH